MPAPERPRPAGGDHGRLLDPDRNLNGDAEFHLAAFAAKSADTSTARAHLQVAARHYLDLVHLDGMARCLTVAAGIALLERNEVRGAELLSAAGSIRIPLEIRPWPMISILEGRWSDGLRRRLGDAEFATAYERGRQLDGERELAELLPLSVGV